MLDISTGSLRDKEALQQGRWDRNRARHHDRWRQNRRRSEWYLLPVTCFQNVNALFPRAHSVGWGPTQFSRMIVTSTMSTFCCLVIDYNKPVYSSSCLFNSARFGRSIVRWNRGLSSGWLAYNWGAGRLRQSARWLKRIEGLSSKECYHWVGRLVRHGIVESTRSGYFMVHVEQAN